MYKIFFYVPQTHLEAVKQALFDKGAGKLGNYDRCAWQSEGVGQFRALAGSHPAVGQRNRLEKVSEWKVETVCDEWMLQEIIHALVHAHPYEKPVYGYCKIEDNQGCLVF